MKKYRFWIEDKENRPLLGHDQEPGRFFAVEVEGYSDFFLSGQIPKTVSETGTPRKEFKKRKDLEKFLMANGPKKGGGKKK